MRGIINWLLGTFAIGAAAMLIIGVLFLVWGAVWEVWNENASHDHPGLYAERACSACSCGLVEVVVAATPTATVGVDDSCEFAGVTPSPTIVPGQTVVPTNTPGPTATPTPWLTATPEPTPTLEPTDIPQPTPTAKVKYNRGIGNGPDGGDPGNSGGKPGEAGEVHEWHGPPGNHQH